MSIAAPDPTRGASAMRAGMLAESDAQAVDAFRDLEIEQRRLDARRALRIADLERRDICRHDGHRSMTAWLRANANWSSGRAKRCRALARLCADLPDVADALLDGRLGVDQAGELARVYANPRCGQLLPTSIAILLVHAYRLGFVEFRICVRRWETLADLDGAHRDRNNAVAGRRASVLPLDGAGVTVSATGGTALQAAELAFIFEAFVQNEFLRDVEASRGDEGNELPADQLPRTDSQRRFDALVNLFRTANNSTAPGTPARVTTNVIVDQHTLETALAAHGLAGSPDDLTPPDPANARCETDRGIPLLPDDIVSAVLDGHVRRVVMTASNVVTNMGTRTRLFTGAVREAAKLQASRCEFPGCTVPATYSQVDHMAEWVRHRGRTATDNAAVLCGKHNRIKFRQYRLRRDRHGQAHFQRLDGTWLTPAGREPPQESELLPLNSQVR